MAIVSTKQKILTEELRKFSLDGDDCKLKEREKYLMLGIFNQTILEINLLKSLQKILSEKPFLSHLTPQNLSKLISTFAIKTCKNDEVIGSCEEKNVYVVIKGELEYKEVFFFYKKGKITIVFLGKQRKHYFKRGRNFR